LARRTETKEAETFSTKNAKGVVGLRTSVLRKKKSGILRRIQRPTEKFRLIPEKRRERFGSHRVGRAPRLCRWTVVVVSECLYTGLRKNQEEGLAR
jgi:hypothetical protein